MEISKNIRAAFELAVKAHDQQSRKSGEPYILHPIEVARICVEEIGLGPTAVVAALLHDVVEDTEVTLKDLHDEFGEIVAKIVDGLTKLDGLHASESPQAENLQKVLRAMLADTRVVLIKMADRLHNLRTIKSMAHHKQLKIAAETAFVYTPLAHRLGLYQVKNEFQDICLKITHPKEYHEIADKLNETKRARTQYIEEFKKPLIHALNEMGVPYRILGRPKSIHSIYQKIHSKEVDFEDIYDLFAIRIVVDVPVEKEKRTAWEVYSIVTDHFQPIPERLKDWITNPKANGYESLHTTVVGPNGRFVEVQVRSERMDEIAEKGFAAHWKYKGIKGMSNANKDVFENWLNQVRDTLENASTHPVEFLNDFQSNFFQEEIHVYTPRGEMRILPAGASALDFAFSIHSDVGCKCQAVKIEKRLVPINYKLKSGDQIEIITSKTQKPTEDWLKYVVTSKAKTRIKASLREEKKKQSELGAEALTRKLNSLRVGFEENVDMLAKHYGYANRIEFLYAVSLGQVNLASLKHFTAESGLLKEIPKVVATPAPEVEAVEALKSAKPYSKHESGEVIINGEPASYYTTTFASCCNPVQGDEIFAYVTVKDGVKIHRVACPNANNMLANYDYRCLKAEWGKTGKADYIVNLEISGIDTGVGVIQRLTGSLSEKLGINIRSFSISGEGGYFKGNMSIVVTNADQLRKVMKQLKLIEGVNSVTRIS